VICEISSIFVDYEGAPAVLAFARDVTERTRLRAQLAHADRLASLGMMAAGIAHEINNPLAFVMLAADMLERDAVVAEGGSTRELVSNIRTGVRRIAAIVRELRTYGQYEEEAPGAVDLATVPRIGREHHGPQQQVIVPAAHLKPLHCAHVLKYPHTHAL